VSKRSAANVLDGAERHAREKRLRGVLDEGHAAAGFDGLQAGGPVVERVREHHADDAPPVGPRRRTEQRVERGAMPVLPGSADDARNPRLKQQMAVVRGYIDASWRDLLTIYSMVGGRTAGVGQNGRQHAARSRPPRRDRTRRACPRRARSLGLGLFITRELVTAHGGTIDVASAEGQCATFTVHLPLLKDALTPAWPPMRT